MRRHSLPIVIVAIACGLLANTTMARAAAATWVSATGSNAGTCPITAPCATFQYALNHTSPNGVINVLSSGDFRPLTITKSISIVADEVEAVIRGGGSIGAAVKIEAGADDIVSLRGLTIDLRSTGNTGISFLSGAALHVHNSVIRGTTNGIDFTPASGTSELHIADSVIADVSSVGIRVVPTGSAGAQATLDRVRVQNGYGHGIVFAGSSTTGSITATVRDSLSAGHSAGTGISASESGGGMTVVTVDRSASVNNGIGIGANGTGATIRIGDSTVTGNITGLATFNGVIASYGTNKVNGNTAANGDPTSTIAMK